MTLSVTIANAQKKLTMPESERGYSPQAFRLVRLWLQS